ncbi:MAG TPA: carboxypeptidase regulatory-like domain-containing protein [Bacteroidota bacterium]|nr:carboxypeptidase regulatory-like domain-containing protein [Bacteroidota bacterium]
MFTKTPFILSFIVVISLISSIAIAGSIKGKVDFKGTKPSTAKIKMNADPRCVKIHTGKEVSSEQVIINENNTLRYVFVYVKKGLEGKKFDTPKEKKTIDQRGCMYSPHIFGMMVNQPLEIMNSDPTLHNIHALPKSSPQFNIAQPKQGMKTTKSFSKPEVMVKIKCDVHSWMASYVGILEHPFYAVSDDKGNFEIKNLPAGDYEIEAWHEKYGSNSMKVSVGAADSKTADFAFEGK